MGTIAISRAAVIPGPVSAEVVLGGGGSSGLGLRVDGLGFRVWGLGLIFSFGSNSNRFYMGGVGRACCGV